MLPSAGGGVDFAFACVSVRVCDVEWHRRVRADGAVLGDSDGDSAGADRRFGDGPGERVGESGRIFCAADCGVLEQEDGKFSFGVYLPGADYDRGRRFGVAAPNREQKRPTRGDRGEMKSFKVAVIAGDGIGKEVVPEGIRV